MSKLLSPKEWVPIDDYLGYEVYRRKVVGGAYPTYKAGKPFGDVDRMISANTLKELHDKIDKEHYNL